MILIVDANIVFSGILKADGKIGDLLINSKPQFTFISPSFLQYEIENHYPKLCKISGLAIDKVFDAHVQICKDITFIPEEEIEQKIWIEAEYLVRDIDPNDVHYVAYALQFNCKIWSGDKALMTGLVKKNFTNFIATSELLTTRKLLRNE